MTRPFPWSILEHHFVKVLDAYVDGKIEMYDEASTARWWALSNELDVELGDEYLEKWRAYRAVNPPPIPDNIVLGDS